MINGGCLIPKRLIYLSGDHARSTQRQTPVQKAPGGLLDEVETGQSKCQGEHQINQSDVDCAVNFRKRLLPQIN